MMKGFSKLIEAIAFRVHSIRHCLRLSPQFFPCPMNAPTWCLWALHFGSNFFTQAADTSWFEAVSTTTHIIPSCFCEQVHVSPACCWLLFYIQYSLLLNITVIFFVGTRLYFLIRSPTTTTSANQIVEKKRRGGRERRVENRTVYYLLLEYIGPTKKE